MSTWGGYGCWSSWTQAHWLEWRAGDESRLPGILRLLGQDAPDSRLRMVVLRLLWPYLKPPAAEEILVRLQRSRKQQQLVGGTVVISTLDLNEDARALPCVGTPAALALLNHLLQRPWMMPGDRKTAVLRGCYEALGAADACRCFLEVFGDVPWDVPTIVDVCEGCGGYGLASEKWPPGLRRCGRCHGLGNVLLAGERVWHGWNRGAISAAARDAYLKESDADLPILADMLEQAGCPYAEMAIHLRSAGPHYPGCWVLDTLRLLMDSGEQRC